MHTATNYYLFSLAISDLMFLLMGKYNISIILCLIISNNTWNASERSEEKYVSGKPDLFTRRLHLKLLLFYATKERLRKFITTTAPIRLLQSELDTLALVPLYNFHNRVAGGSGSKQSKEHPMSRLVVALHRAHELECIHL